MYVDLLAVGLAWLREHPVVLAAFGGPDHVTGENEPPYPHLRLVPLPGDDRGYGWLRVAQVQVEVWGDPDGRPGPAEMSRLLYVALHALAELPSRPAEPGVPVVTHVGSGVAGAPLPGATKQPRWGATVDIVGHPAHPAAV